MATKTLLGMIAVLSLGSALAHADPAVVINPAGGCGFFDGNGNFAFSSNTQIVATQSANENATLKCQATVTPSSTGRAVQFDFASTGAECFIPAPTGAFATTEWHETVSASGEATLICKSKN